MKLLAEAGATNIQWVIISKNGKYNFRSVGYNPNISDANLLMQILISSFPTQFDANEITTIEYFGTGCSSSIGKERVKNALNKFFIGTREILIHTDLLGSARALLGKYTGIIGILGTGANAGYYNGNIIEYQSPSVGYLLGDEGSGAYLGKLFLAAVLRDELETDLIVSFYKKFKLNKQQLVQLVYSNAQVNKYFASFVPFLKENQNIDGIHKIIEQSFLEYISKYLKPVLKKYANNKIVMVGGVASNFESMLREAFELNSLVLVDVEQNPLERLQAQYLL